jgi:hypothetical protein
MVEARANLGDLAPFANLLELMRPANVQKILEEIFPKRPSTLTLICAAKKDLIVRHLKLYQSPKQCQD